MPPDVETTENAIRFLEDRVRRDPDDFIAYNKLAAYYFQRQRETGGLNYLELALRAARASLAAIPADRHPQAGSLITVEAVRRAHGPAAGGGGEGQDDDQGGSPAAREHLNGWFAGTVPKVRDLLVRRW